VFAPNGTLALALALMALEIGPGDEILIPDITFIGSANAALLSGAVPVFVDVDRDSFQIDLAHAARLVGPRTRAIMPVHLYGSACDMTAVCAFANQHGLLVIEDAAQAIGVMHRGQHAGSFGDAGCFSFFADKTLTTGEGGFVVCKEEKVYERLRLLRNQGRLNAGTFLHPSIGYNFRITDIQAAIGLVQMRKLPEIVARKHQIYEWYKQDLAPIAAVRLLGPASESNHVPFRAVILAENAFDLMAFLTESAVQAREFFHPMHSQPCFAGLVDADNARFRRHEDYPNANYGYSRGVCLPIYPTLRREQVSYIAQKIGAFYGSAATS
jgi:perosamine synthetase